MRITSCRNTFDAHVEPGDSQELRNIAIQLMPEWLSLFSQKNKDYGNNAKELGLRGQFADIWRKVAKLKRSMWDGEELQFEGTEEIIMDLIGHLFLSLNMMRVAEEAERAYVYNEDDAAVDALFSMVGNDPVAALGLASSVNPPFRNLIKQRALAMIEADQQEKAAVRSVADGLVAEAKGLVPAAVLGAGLGRATDEAAAAEDGASLGSYEAFDEPVSGASEGDVIAGLFGTAFEPKSSRTDFVSKVAQAAERFRSQDAETRLARLKVGKSTFEGIVTGVHKTEMSLAEWLYRRHGQGVTEWDKLEPHFKRLWEIEAEAAIQVGRRNNKMGS